MADATTACAVCGGRQVLRFRYRGYRYHRCPACGLVSTWPLPTPQEVEAHYDRRHAEGNYQLLCQSADAYLPVYVDLARMLEERFSSLAKKERSAAGRVGHSLDRVTVLDIGCFTGDFMAVLADRDADVYGVELQKPALEIAQRRFGNRVFQAEVRTNTLPDLRLDAATLLAVIEHVRDPRSLLTATARLLKSGGVIMVQTPNSMSLLARLMGRYWPPYEPVEHIHLFSAGAMHRLLTELGFHDLKVTRHWKRLPVEYVYEMLSNFGPELRRLAQPFYTLLPASLRRMSAPFYIGEMVTTGVKS